LCFFVIYVEFLTCWAIDIGDKFNVFHIVVYKSGLGKIRLRENFK